MIIGVDIDGTLNDNFTYLVQLATTYFGKSIEAQIWDWDLATLFQVNSSEVERFWTLYEKEFYSSPLPKKGAAFTLHNLKQKNIGISIITARDEQYRQSTQLWLDSHNIPYDQLLMTPNKHEACQIINAKAMIEDSPEYASLSKNLPYILFDHPYNSHIKGPNIYRVHEWKDVKDIIEDLFHL